MNHENHESLLSSLIETKSLSGNEGELRQLIKAWFTERGIEAFEQDNNLCAVVKGADSTRAFIFNSHMDTVSPDETQWTSGPWSPKVIGDKMIGLGSSDLKSGLAATMLLADIYANKERPAVDTWFTYVVKEEVDGSGTASFVDWAKGSGEFKKYRDTAAILTEPTGLQSIEHGHRGNIFIKVEIKGDGGHAAKPWLIKKHPVIEMFRIAKELEAAVSAWSQEFPSPTFRHATVGMMTSISAGLKIENPDNPIVSPASVNVIPSSCTATFDIRTQPGLHEVIVDRLNNFARTKGIAISLTAKPSAYGLTPLDSKVIIAATREMGNPQITVADWATDLGKLVRGGIPSIILGPGEPDQLHKPNEFCYLSKIPRAVAIYSSIVIAWSRL